MDLSRHMRGFTLIELTVVITIVAAMLFFTMPRLGRSLILSDQDSACRQIISSVKLLRKMAVESKITHALHMDLSLGTMWYVHDQMPPEEKDRSESLAVELTDQIRIEQVVFPLKNKTEYDLASIRFFPAGYSDKALIYIRKGYDQRLILQIEPFLSEVILVDRDDYR